jgi:hypothetical protein
MAVNKRLLQGAAAAGELVPSEHFGVVLYEGDGSSPHSINGGKFGAGAYFNGSNGYIDITGVPNFSSTGLSISAWVYSDSFASVSTIVNLYGNNSIVWYIDGSGNMVRSGQGTTITSTSTVATGSWQHCVMTVDNTGFLTYYINGSAAGSGDSTTSIFNDNNSSDLIGAYMGSPSGFFSGKIDQLRIFQKELSSSEVSTLYAETAATVESLDPLSEDTTDTLQVLGDSSCIATYQFENDETDLSGNYDATGAAIQYAAGRYGQAASYDGSNSKVSISALGFLTGDVDFSVSMWVKFDNVSGDKCLFAQGANAGTFQATGYIVRGNNQVYHNNYGAADFFSGSFTFSADVWTHIAFSYNSTSNVHTMYINGSSAGTLTKEIALQSNNTGGCIGADQLGGTKFKGEIDQTRIFNKTLSASEVTTLYNENSLIASYRFEGNANDDTRNYDGTASNVTYEYGLNFTPDFIWIKERTSTSNNVTFDSTRGIQEQLYITTAAQSTNTSTVLSFDSGGFSLGIGTAVNETGQDYVGWCLKANGGTTSSNTDGTITSTVQANQDSGFSIVKYTGTGSAATVGHGLSSSPEMVIVKNLSSGSTNWWTWHKDLGGGDKYVALDSSSGVQTASTIWNSTSPTSSVFSVGTDSGANGSGTDVIAYCFHSVDSFSKIGSYVGNGSENGPIVETGFEPAFLMTKQTDDTSNWVIVDNKRSTTNPRDKGLRPNTSDSESTVSNNLVVDFLSNGFQLKQTSGSNANNGNFIYIAFAADPDTEAPTVAKSFNTITYDGTGVDGLAITGVGFKPSMVWIKNRDSVRDHNLADIVQGVSKEITPNTTEAQENRSVTSFDSDGFTLDNASGNYNDSSSNYVSWIWATDDNEPTINTEGSIDSIVSANANAGFSIVKWTANGSDVNIGHGLSAAPELIIMKNISSGTSSDNWVVGNSESGWTKAMHLDLTNADNASDFYWNDTAPTSTVFTAGAGAGVYQRSGDDFIAYCFHSVSGYSKISSYQGNGSTQSITGLGFQPDWLMIKRATGGSSNGWVICDSVRGVGINLRADTSGAEADESAYTTSFDSDGFTLAQAGGNTNVSGSTYIYMAFKIN